MRSTNDPSRGNCSILYALSYNVYATAMDSPPVVPAALFTRGAALDETARLFECDCPRPFSLGQALAQ